MSAVGKTVVTSLATLGERLRPRVSARIASDYARRGMPGVRGAWVVQDCQAWVDEHITRRDGKTANERKASKNAAKDEPDPLLTGVASPALEKYRDARTELAILELRERQGEVIPREEVHQSLSRIAAIIRGAGDVLEKRFGPEAANVLRDAIREMQREFNEFAGARKPTRRNSA